MSALPWPQMAQNGQLLVDSSCSRTRTRTRLNSTSSSVTTCQESDFYAPSTTASATSTTSTETTHPIQSKLDQELSSSMTTYYHYDDGHLVGTSTFDPASQYLGPWPQYSSCANGGDIVGANLANRTLEYPAYSISAIHHHPYNFQQQNTAYQTFTQPCGYDTAPEPTDHGYWSNDEYDSHRYAPLSDSALSTTPVHMDFAPQSMQGAFYPDPEEIRHLHTLYSLLSHIHPERKLQSLLGPVVDIIEQDTGVTFAYDVPKKLLVLFLGRAVVTKFLRTLERRDNMNWRGPPTRQVLDLPRGHASKAAMRILLAWMIRACQYHTMHNMQRIRVPRNTFAACSLAQTLQLFSLHKDAYRLDESIARDHFFRPLYADEVATLWNCLGEHNRYVYAAIKATGKRFKAFTEDGQDFRDSANMRAMLEGYPQLKARVYVLEVNEEYRPTFGTGWMRRLGGGVPREEEQVEEVAEVAAGDHVVQVKADEKDTQSCVEPKDLDISAPKTYSKAMVLRIVNEE